MILIADSGSTKTDWCYGTEISNCKIIQTKGINPFHQSAEKIESIICQGLIPQLGFPLERCTAIYFYGAGCLPPKTESIIHVLQNNFPEADIAVDTDLLGAARALCKDNAGIACILGTGSNSCLYDGKQIIQNISPLGYILGDEGIYYYFDTKEEIVLACAEEAISRIEQGAFSIALEDIKDVANMMNHLGTLADELSPVMRFLVSVCVSQEYGNKVKPYLVQLAGRYPYYTKKIAEILGCTAAEVEPYVHLSILALNNYMIFNERALFLPQIEAAKKGLMQLAKRKG